MIKRLGKRKRKIDCYFLLFLLSITYSHSRASVGDSIVPTKGQPVPSYMKFYLDSGGSQSQEFVQMSGKWTVLYFWNQYCGTCLQNLPLLNSYQNELSKNLKILLIGYTGSQYGGISHDKSIRTLYDSEKGKNNLQLSIAFDSISFHKIGIYSCPYIVIVDPNGIIQAITESVTKNDLQDFINGTIPELPRAWRKDENSVRYNKSVPFLVNENGGKDHDFIYRSIISQYENYMPIDYQFKVTDSLFQVVGVRLRELYLYAYFGLTRNNFDFLLYRDCYPFPILNIKSTKLFESDLRLRKGLFCYSVYSGELGKNDSMVRSYLRDDLGKVFKLKVKVEKRMMPVWKLVSVQREVDKGSVDSFNLSYYENAEDLLRTIYYETIEHQYILIDESNGATNIPVEKKCKFDDFESINNSLRMASLKLEKVMKEMKVLVISE